MGFLQSHDQVMKRLEDENLELCKESLKSAKLYRDALIESDCSDDVVNRSISAVLAAQERYASAASATVKRREKRKADSLARREKYSRFTYLVIESWLWIHDRLYGAATYRRKSGWATIEK